MGQQGKHRTGLFTLLFTDVAGSTHLKAALESKKADSATSGGAVSDQFAEARSRIPPQEAGTPENLIDLSDYYDQPLSEAWLGSSDSCLYPFRPG